MNRKRFLAVLAILPALGLLSCGDASTPTSSSSKLTEVSASKPAEVSTSTPDEKPSESSTTPSKTWAEVLEDGDITVTDVPDIVVVKADQTFNITVSWGKQSNTSVELTSSDETLLPVSAIKTSKTGTDGTFDSGCVLAIDGSKLTKTGEVYLEIAVSSIHTSSWGGTVCVKLTLDDAPEVTYWNETLHIVLADNVDTDLEEGQKAIFQVSDSDHIAGTPNPNRDDGNTYGWFQVDITALFDGTKEVIDVPFQYAVGHEHSLSGGIQKEDGYYVSGKFFTFEDTLTGGSSDTGFTGLDDGKLTFLEENDELTVTINGYQS